MLSQHRLPVVKAGEEKQQVNQVDASSYHHSPELKGFIMRIVFLLTVVAFCSVTDMARGQGSLNETELQDKLTAATVYVSAVQPDGTVTNGTGWVLHKQERFVVTAAHLLRNAVRVQVIFAAQSNTGWVKNLAALQKVSSPFTAEVVSLLSHLDFAVLRVPQIPASAEVLRLAATAPAPGSAVYAVSHSSKASHLFHFERGTVAFTGFGAVKLGEQESGLVKLRSEVICYRAKNIDRGSSGCALVNKAGEVVGLASMNSVLKGQDSPNCVAISIRELLQLVENNGSTPTAKPNTLVGRWVGTLQNGSGEIGMELTSAGQVAFLIPAGGKLVGTYQLKGNSLLVKINGKLETMVLEWLDDQEFRLNSAGMSMVCQRHDCGLTVK